MISEFQDEKFYFTILVKFKIRLFSFDHSYIFSCVQGLNSKVYYITLYFVVSSVKFIEVVDLVFI